MRKVQSKVTGRRPFLQGRGLLPTVAVGALFAGGTAYAQWGFTGCEQAGSDLGVVGTLSGLPVLFVMLGVHGLAARVMWRRAKPECRPVVVVGALAPPLLIAGANGSLYACVLLGASETGRAQLAR